MNKFSKFIAFRYIVKSRNKGILSLISLISIIGLTLAVASLITILSVMDGFLLQMRDTILKTTSHSNFYKLVGTFDNYEEMSLKIKETEGVAGYAPVLFKEVLVSYDKEIAGALINGVDAEKFHTVSDVPEMMKAGKFLCLKNPEKCVEIAKDTEVDPLIDFLEEEPLVVPPVIIGTDMAERLRVEKGSIITVTSPIGGKTKGREPVPVSMAFKVVGIFDTGLHDYDSRYIYGAIEDIQQFLQVGKSVSFISIKVKDIEKLKEVNQRILNSAGGFPYALQDWQEMHKTTFRFLQLQKTVMFIILLFIILVASFGIITTLIMLVISKTSEISILRALGASKSVIVKIFMIDGFVIGLSGTVLGSILAVIVCLLLKNIEFPLSKEIYFFSSLPVEMSFVSFASVIAASLSISVLATLYPSIKASGITPVEGLRYER